MSAYIAREKLGRTAAVLTTSEVAGTTFNPTDAWGNGVTVDLSFTLGSLTNVTIRFYASNDGTTWKPVRDHAGNLSYELTADTEGWYTFALPGTKFFRASVQGSGTVTGSEAEFTYRYTQRGSQG